MNIRCAILITCFNRKSKTLACLSSIYAQKIDNSVKLDCFLVDDGSTDGTSEAIKVQFPQVNLIQGNGELYWNGGMRIAWQAALTQEYDFYLWLNDDIELYNEAINRLIFSFKQLEEKEENLAVLVGTLSDPETAKPTYGGRSSLNKQFPLKYGDVIKPDNEPKPCDFINGNCTLVSAKAVNKIGILSAEFTHSMGDFDYGLRLAKAELSCWVAPEYYGTCSRNKYKEKYTNTALSLKQRIALIKKPTILPPPNEWKIYIRKHGGSFRFLLYIKVYIRKYFPIFWVINWKK